MIPALLSIGALALPITPIAAAPQATPVGRSVGEVHPDFELPTVQRDRTIRLSDYRGQKVLLIEFASW